MEVLDVAEAPCVISVEKIGIFRVWEGVETAVTAGRLERIKRNPPFVKIRSPPLLYMRVAVLCVFCLLFLCKYYIYYIIKSKTDRQDRTETEQETRKYVQVV